MQEIYRGHKLSVCEWRNENPFVPEGKKIELTIVSDIFWFGPASGTETHNVFACARAPFDADEATKNNAIQHAKFDLMVYIDTHQKELGLGDLT